MLNIGCHLSTARGFLGMGRDALAIGANTFQFFTRNPRGGKAKDLDQADIDAFLAVAAESGFGKLLAHAPYTLNPCSADPKTRAFAQETMQDDLQRMEKLPGHLYNFHPGSHVGQGEDVGIALIIEQLNTVLTPDLQTSTASRSRKRWASASTPATCTTRAMIWSTTSTVCSNSSIGSLVSTACMPSTSMTA